MQEVWNLKITHCAADFSENVLFSTYLVSWNRQVKLYKVERIQIYPMNGSNWWNPILRNECHIFSSKWVDSLCCLMRGRARGQKDRPFLATAQWVKPNKNVLKQNRLFIKVHVVQSQSITLFCQLTKEYRERRHDRPFKFLFLPKIGL